MPRLFKVCGYYVYFWSNENDPLEPVHVHVAKEMHANATKIWILSNKKAEVDEPSREIGPADMKRILRTVEGYAGQIIESWKQFHGEITYKDTGYREPEIQELER